VPISPIPNFEQTEQLVTERFSGILHVRKFWVPEVEIDTVLAPGGELAPNSLIPAAYWHGTALTGTVSTGNVEDARMYDYTLGPRNELAQHEVTVRYLEVTTSGSRTSNYIETDKGHLVLESDSTRLVYVTYGLEFISDSTGYGGPKVGDAYSDDSTAICKSVRSEPLKYAGRYLISALWEKANITEPLVTAQFAGVLYTVRTYASSPTMTPNAVMPGWATSYVEDPRLYDFQVGPLGQHDRYVCTARYLQITTQGTRVTNYIETDKGHHSIRSTPKEIVYVTYGLDFVPDDQSAGAPKLGDLLDIDQFAVCRDVNSEEFKYHGRFIITATWIHYIPWTSTSEASGTAKTALRELNQREFGKDLTGMRWDRAHRVFEGPTATVESDANTTLPIYSAWPTANAVVAGAKVYSAVFSSTTGLTTITADTANAFAAVSAGNCLMIGSYGGYIIAGKSSSTVVTVNGDATGSDSPAQSLTSAYDEYSPVVHGYKIPEDNLTGVSLVNAIYMPIKHGVLRMARGYMEPNFSAEQMTARSTDGYPMGASFWSDPGKTHLYRYVTQDSAGKVLVPILRWTVRVYLVTPPTANIRSTIGCVNKDPFVCSEGTWAPGTLLFLAPERRPLSMNSRQCEYTFVMEEKSAVWNTTFKYKQQEYMLGSDGYTFGWEDITTGIAATPYSDVSFAWLNQYVI
jgi:hypothetical protein